MDSIGKPLLKLQDIKSTYKNQYTNNKIFEKEAKEISFTIASKIMKYLGTNLIKEVKYLYTENYKTIKRNKDTNKCEDIPCSCIRGINVTISILPKVIYRLNVISFKIPITFFIEKCSKIHIQQPKIMNSQSNA